MTELALSDVDVFNLALDLLKEAPITAFTDDTAEAEWGTRNYALARNAELREHPWKFALKRKVLYPNDFVLDGITATLTGAWAPFRLTQKWSGNLARIRRSSDSTTLDVAHAEDELLIDTDAISTFIGSGTGYFDRFYDQSRNSRSLVQATTTKQPLYEVEAGDAEIPAAVFDGTDDFLATAGAMSTMISTTVGYVVMAGLLEDMPAASAALVNWTGNGISATTQSGLLAVNDDGSADSIDGGLEIGKSFVASWRHTGGNLYLRINGQDEISAASGTTSSLSNVLSAGATSTASNPAALTLFALLVFSTIPTEAERNRIVSRLMRWCAAPGAEEFGWEHRYPVPSDCLRMLPLREEGEFEGRLIPHEIEQGYILTDKGTELKVRYISEFTDTTRFDPLFVEALAARMAVKMAHWLTGKANMVQIASNAYKEAISKATLANSLESTSERPADEEVIDQRYDAEGVR